MTYTLEPYNGPKSRYYCPACDHKNKTFSRYINTETDEYLAEHVGRCSRENNCSYHYKPHQYFESIDHRPWSIDNGNNLNAKKYYGLSTIDHRPKEPDYYIHSNYVNASFTNYQDNNFVQYLITLFGFDKADELVGRYRIGTSSHWPGATVFWQLDTEGLVRTGKVMLYNADTGKRVKEPFNHITWVHSLLSSELSVVSGEYALSQNSKPIAQNFILKQCLFGEHLLNDEPTKPVAIVESEKTAIMASALLPEFTWLATGSLNNLTPEKCTVLKGRKVYLFPDLNAYDKWRQKMLSLQALMPGTYFKIFKGLEDKANDEQKTKGLDLGDLLGRR